MKPQARTVLEHLKLGKAITSLDALALYGISRLAARIGEIRAAGYEVTADRRSVTKADGTTAHVASYRLGG